MTGRPADGVGRHAVHVRGQLRQRVDEWLDRAVGCIALQVPVHPPPVHLASGRLRRVERLLVGGDHDLVEAAHFSMTTDIAVLAVTACVFLLLGARAFAKIQI